MQPAIYGPYRYLPITERKHFSWPDGNRLALWVIPNIEFFHLDDPMPGVNNERASTHAKIPNVRNWALRDYGNRVGIWRFFEVMSRYGIRGTAALNSDICEYHPQIIETGVKLGWEFMGHCQTNAMRLNELDARARAGGDPRDAGAHRQGHRQEAGRLARAPASRRPGTRSTT